MRLTRIVMLAASLALVAAACGGDDNNAATTTPPATTSPAPVETTASPTETATSGGTTLVLEDNEFDPKDFTLSGTTITLSNEGAALHNFSVEGQDIDKDVNPGETETEDLELAPGTYNIFCKYHESIGMVGTLTISG
jgi:plastocyanin